jgi:FAD/FMN-containing dehydrogenase
LTDLLRELIEVAGTRHVLVEPAAQQRFLRDFSWYSPVLADAFVDTRIDAVVQPGTLDELEAAVALGVRHRVPITVRGAGTGNYGQSVPLYGGILFDMRRLNRIAAHGEDTIEVEAGAVWGQVDVAARKTGRELRIMPTTYHVATVAGFLAGGSGGLGAVTYGRTWDNYNFPSVDLLTADETATTCGSCCTRMAPLGSSRGCGCRWCPRTIGKAGLPPSTASTRATNSAGT